MKTTFTLLLFVISVSSLAQTQEKEIKPPPAKEGTTEVVIFEEPPIEESRISGQSDQIYYVVEQQPQYSKGFEKWDEYVKGTLKYPEDAATKKIEGNVYVQFTVQETGKLTDFEVVRGISVSCDKEAIRVIQESGDWQAGRQKGVAVKVRFVMPIKFRLPSEGPK